MQWQVAQWDFRRRFRPSKTPQEIKNDNKFNWIRSTQSDHWPLNTSTNCERHTDHKNKTHLFRTANNNDNVSSPTCRWCPFNSCILYSNTSKQSTWQNDLQQPTATLPLRVPTSTAIYALLSYSSYSQSIYEWISSQIELNLVNTKPNC